METLTSDEHDADGEDLFGVGVGRNVAKADARQRTEREVESGDVLGVPRGSASLVVRLVSLLGEIVKPTYVLVRVLAFVVADDVPDASQPMSDECEGGHEEEEYGSSVLTVAVQLACHPHQPQETRRFEQTKQSGCLQQKLCKTYACAYLQAYCRAERD